MAGTSRGHRRLRRQGTLSIIATMLIVSAMIRIGSEAGQAFALEPSEKPMPAPPKVNDAPLDREWTTAELNAILENLERREAALEQREETYRASLAELKAADDAIERKLSELAASEQRLNTLLSVAQEASEADVSQLTDVYNTMKPKDAAAVFEQMDPQFAAGFLARMNPESAARIMSGLSPEVAYTISAVLAGRHAHLLPAPQAAQGNE